ncbi:fibronectin type III domain-containing protein [Nocardioides sp. MH1]|uniref:fibronectin type III domain-containing protein n=1 Tax=Nocardioides sp. MH1 TaxID=3242490 RepID=UPI00351FE0B5
MKRLSLRRLLSIPAAAAAALAAVTLSPAAPAHAADGWISGPLEETTITNCSSIILGSPYQEFGIGAFASYYGDRSASPISPRTGDSTYLDLYAELVGNHCSTPFIFPKFVLPSGVQFDTTAPIKCYYTPPGGTQYQITQAQQCPQWSNVAADGRYSNSYSGWYSGWPLPSGPNFTFGSAWEFLVPIKTTTQQNGSQLRVQLDLADGNGSDPLQLSVPFWTGAPRTSAPDAPTNVTANPTSSTSAQVSFTPPANNGGSAITGYDASCTSPDGGVSQVGGGTASPINVTGLTPGKSYRCQVRAKNAVGPGSWSTQSTTITLPAAATVPGRATNVTGTPTSATTANVSFTPPAANGSPITGYVAQCVSGNGGTTRAATGTASPITVRNLTPGKAYQCKVRAANAVGNGQFSALSAAFTQPATRPGAPTNVTAAPSTAGRVKVSFSPPASDGGSAITSYLAQCVSTNGGVTRSRTGASSPILVTGLTSGKTYHCKVRATNAAGTSPMSAFSTNVQVV